MARSGFEVQQAAIKALFLRELKTRFGKFRLGYLWAVLEPAAHLLILFAIFGYAMHRTMPGMSFPVFLLNGIIPFFIFSNIANRAIGAIEANQGLFNYRPIKPIDTLIARAILETVIYIMVYVLLMTMLHMLGESFSISNIIFLVLIWTLLVFLSFGVGLIFMVIGKTFPETEKFLPIIVKPLYFVSGVMIPLNSIPKELWPYISWNPILHALELTRVAIIPGYVSDGVSLGYLSMCTLITIFIGLALYRSREKAMLTS